MKADSGIAGGGGYISPPEFFKRLKPDADGLERFGFAKNGSAWEYSAKVAGGALVARLTADKVGGDKKDTVEIVNLRRTEGMDASRFLPAYHMNKKTWATVVIDGAAKADELRRFLVVSRENADGIPPRGTRAAQTNRFWNKPSPMTTTFALRSV